MIKLITPLMGHQVDAVNKMLGLKVGALFMEQGTGKTRTALELISKRLEENKINSILWLCPCSVKENLKNDIIKHCGCFPPEILIQGIQSLSSSVSANENCLKYVTENKCFLIVDESLLVKNPNAIRSKNIIRLSLLCKYKLILNGTPISRTISDLFSQFYILDWRILGYKSYWSFSTNHLEFDETGKIKNCLNTEYLVNKIAPYSFELKKSDCISLPDKVYHTISYEMDYKQNIEYERVANELLSLFDEQKPETIYRLFSGLQLVISGRYVTTSVPMQSHKMFDKISDNPRIKALEQTNFFINSDEKVIIFCKYSDEITDIITYLTSIGETAVRFDGSISQKQRNTNLDKFKSNSRFLVANKTCAGFGLNLQFCSNIVFYSNDWDFATRSQAEDRIYRIGQEKECNIYDIVCSETLDERILKSLKNKESVVEELKKRIKEKNFKKWLKGE